MQINFKKLSLENRRYNSWRLRSASTYADSFAVGTVVSKGLPSIIEIYIDLKISPVCTI